MLYGTARAGGSHDDGVLFSINTAAVPEPSGLYLAITGALSLAAYAWTTRRHLAGAQKRFANLVHVLGTSGAGFFRLFVLQHDVAAITRV
jgi:uncharacterized repeat protein (TIGR03803 family)